MKNGQKILLKYFFAVIIAASFSILLLYINGYWETESLKIHYKLLSDAFTTPGVVMIMIGCLIWISTYGIFDGLGYAFRRAGSMFIPLFPASYRHETYYDYKTSKQDKRAHGYSFMFFVGIAFLVLGIVFLILYSQAHGPKV